MALYNHSKFPQKPSMRSKLAYPQPLHILSFVTACDEHRCSAPVTWPFPMLHHLPVGPAPHDADAATVAAIGEVEQSVGARGDFRTEAKGLAQTEPAQTAQSFSLADRKEVCWSQVQAKMSWWRFYKKCFGGLFVKKYYMAKYRNFDILWDSLISSIVKLPFHFWSFLDIELNPCFGHTSLSPNYAPVWMARTTVVFNEPCNLCL